MHRKGFKMTKYETLVPRFIKYVKKETRSDENSTTVPSTATQVEFAKEIAEELKNLGMSNVRISPESGYVFATLESNLDKDVKSRLYRAHGYGRFQRDKRQSADR